MGNEETNEEMTALTTGPAVPDTMSADDVLWSPEAFGHAQRVAKLFANSELIPGHLRGKLPDVTIALVMARRLDEDPLIVMQNMYSVHGNAGWNAQYVIARANKSGVFSTRLNWREEGSGKDLEVTCFAKLADSDEEVSFTASMEMARAEKWTKNPKYTSMPKLMLRYRSAVFLVRLFAPEIMLGIPTSDEVQDVRASRVVQAARDDAADVSDWLKKNKAPVADAEVVEPAALPDHGEPEELQPEETREPAVIDVESEPADEPAEPEAAPEEGGDMFSGLPS